MIKVKVQLKKEHLFTLQGFDSVNDDGFICRVGTGVPDLGFIVVACGVLKFTLQYNQYSHKRILYRSCIQLVEGANSVVIHVISLGNCIISGRVYQVAVKNRSIIVFQWRNYL